MSNILVGLLLLSLLIGAIVGGVYLAETLTKQPVAAPQASVSGSPQVAQDTTLLTTDGSGQTGALTYKVWKEETHDTPLNTYVIMEIVVSGNITHEGLDVLLRGLFRQIRERKDFKYHDQPGVQIAAYASVAHAESEAGLWIALLNANGEEAYPELSFSENQLALVAKPPEKRLGLTEKQRMAIFYEIVKAEDQSWKEAMRRYPDLDPNSPLLHQRLLDQSNENDRLLEIHKNQLAAKYGLTREQLSEIGREGADKSWPMPPSP